MPATESPASSIAGRTSSLRFDVRPAPAPRRIPVLLPNAVPTGVAKADEASGTLAVPRATPAAGVLVTGSHCSGTTRAGKTLAEAPGLCYLHEPFKPRWDPPYVWTNFDTWFLHVGPHNAAEHEHAVARTLGLHFSWRRHFAGAPSLGQAWAATGRW